MLRTIFLLSALVSIFSINRAAADSEPNWNELRQGKVLYGKMCAKCHGPSGKPLPAITALLKPAPSDLSSPVYRYGSSVSQITETIRVGKGVNMFGFKNRLAEEQIQSLARYVRTLIVRNPTESNLLTQ